MRVSLTSRTWALACGVLAMLGAGLAGGAGIGAKIRRHPAAVSPRQPGQRVDPRGGDDLGGRAVHGACSTTSSCSISTKSRTGRNSSEPELAESWSWNDDYTRLSFKLRQGVKWHDGKPFTAADVKCTWDMLIGKSQDKLRLNPRKAWYRNLDDVVDRRRLRGDLCAEAAAAGLSDAARLGGMSPVYPCHVPPAEMRQHPIGTGPFKFVEFKPQRIHQAGQEHGLLEAGPALSRRHRVDDHPEPRDPDARLYRRQVRHDLSLRGHRRRSMHDIKSQAPTAICEIDPTMVAINLLVNRDNAAVQRSRHPPGDAC